MTRAFLENVMNDAKLPDYYAARAKARWQLAENVRDREVKQMHAQMAQDYDKLAANLERSKLRLAF